MAKLAQRLCLYLAYAFPGNIEFPPNLFQSAGLSVVQPEAEAQHLLLPWSKRIQHLHELLLEQRKSGNLCGGGRIVVGYKVAKVAVLLLAYRRFEGHRLLRYLDYLTYLLLAYAHLPGYLVRPGLAAVLLQKLAVDADKLVYGLYHMDRYPYCTGLVGYGAGYGLSYPPRGVGGELIALAVVELFHCLYKAQIALLNKVQEQHSAANVALRNGYHQTQVSLCQLLLCILIAVRHALGYLYLLSCAEKRHFAYLLEVHSHGVVYSHALCAAKVRLQLGYIAGDVVGYFHLFDHIYIQRLKAIIYPLYLL